MSRVILEPYDIYLAPVRDLPHLEDVIERGYSTEEESHKTVEITVRKRPAAMNYAIDSLIDQGYSNYFSVIERHAVLYGVSLVEDIVKQIANKKREMSRTGMVWDLELVHNSSSGLKFKTMTIEERSGIHMPSWCKEWIGSNSRYLGMHGGTLAVFLVIRALSKSNIINPHVSSLIQEESNWFLEYLKLSNDKMTK